MLLFFRLITGTQSHKLAQIFTKVSNNRSKHTPSARTQLEPNGVALFVKSQHESVSQSHSVRIVHQSKSPSTIFIHIRCRPSSGQVLLWKSAKVPALKRLVHCVNEGVDHFPHGSSERVEGRPLGPRAFEVAVLVALGAQQPLLTRGDVQKSCDESQLREQRRLQVLVMYHQQTAAPLQPAESVRRPPGGVAGDKLWPFCGAQTWFRQSDGHNLQQKKMWLNLS